MNLDEKRNLSPMNKNSSNNLSDRKISATRCEACRSKSNQKILDISRADSNLFKIKNQDKSDSSLDKSNLSKDVKNQI